MYRPPYCNPNCFYYDSTTHPANCIPGVSYPHPLSNNLRPPPPGSPTPVALPPVALPAGHMSHCPGGACQCSRVKNTLDSMCNQQPILNLDYLYWLAFDPKISLDLLEFIIGHLQDRKPVLIKLLSTQHDTPVGEDDQLPLVHCFAIHQSTHPMLLKMLNDLTFLSDKGLMTAFSCKRERGPYKNFSVWHHFALNPSAIPDFFTLLEFFPVLLKKQYILEGFCALHPEIQSTDTPSVWHLLANSDSERYRRLRSTHGHLPDIQRTPLSTSVPTRVITRLPYIDMHAAAREAAAAARKAAKEAVEEPAKEVAKKLEYGCLLTPEAQPTLTLLSQIVNGLASVVDLLPLYMVVGKADEGAALLGLIALSVPSKTDTFISFSRLYMSKRNLFYGTSLLYWLTIQAKTHQILLAILNSDLTLMSIPEVITALSTRQTQGTYANFSGWHHLAFNPATRRSLLRLLEQCPMLLHTECVLQAFAALHPKLPVDEKNPSVWYLLASVSVRRLQELLNKYDHLRDDLHIINNIYQQQIDNLRKIIGDPSAVFTIN